MGAPMLSGGRNFLATSALTPADQAPIRSSANGSAAPALHGSFLSWERSLSKAAPDCRAAVFNNALLDLYETAKKVGTSHIEISDWGTNIGQLYDIGGDDDLQSIIVGAKRAVEEKLARTALPTPASPITASREGRRLVIRCADQIEPRAVEWLWSGRIARGKLAVFGGDPGLGKSKLLLFIAGAFSNGGQWPCNEGRAPCGHVIILSAEDGAEDTIIPGLMAAGADRSKIHIISAVREGDDRKMFNLQHDLDLLEKYITEIRRPGDSVVAVIIDPLTAYLGRVDSHKMAEMRAVLGPIAEMAARLNVAVIGNTHLSKSADNNKALYRFVGSIATIAAARTAFVIVEDHEDSTRRLFLNAKNNLAPIQPGMAFRVEQHIVAPGVLGSTVGWESGHVNETADSALTFDGGQAGTAKDDAIELLQRILADGPLLVREIEREARDCGLLGDTAQIGQCKPLRAARQALGVKVSKDGMRGGWVWSLPDAPVEDGGNSSPKAPLAAEHATKMPSKREDALQGTRAPSGVEGTFGGDPGALDAYQALPVGGSS
jgi:putative DNA primase/helicase